MTDLVSIYVPTRNRRPLLQRAVESVLAQTHPAIELIVVDDASTDDTGPWLDALAAADARVVALHQPQARGAPAARNRALAMARGEFVTGLDDDDAFAPERIARFVQAWALLAAGTGGTGLACLFSDSLMVDGSRRWVTTDRKDEVRRDDLFVHNFIGNQVFCPRRHLLDIGGFDEQMPAWQDMELFMRLLARFGVARRIQPPTYVCHVERGRERVSASETRLRAAFARLLDKHPDQPELVRQQLALQLFSPFYGFRPRLQDWRRMLRPGTPPHVWRRFLRAAIRNHLVR